jgi:hypothetical protein
LRLKLLPEALVRDELLLREDVESIGTAKTKKDARKARHVKTCPGADIALASEHVGVQHKHGLHTADTHGDDDIDIHSFPDCMQLPDMSPQTKPFGIAATFRCFAQPSRRCMMWWLPNLGGFHGGRIVFDFGLIQTVAVTLSLCKPPPGRDSHQPYSTYTTLTRPCWHWSFAFH